VPLNILPNTNYSVEWKVFLELRYVSKSVPEIPFPWKLEIGESDFISQLFFYLLLMAKVRQLILKQKKTFDKMLTIFEVK